MPRRLSEKFERKATVRMERRVRIGAVAQLVRSIRRGRKCHCFRADLEQWLAYLPKPVVKIFEHMAASMDEVADEDVLV